MYRWVVLGLLLAAASVADAQFKDSLNIPKLQLDTLQVIQSLDSLQQQASVSYMAIRQKYDSITNAINPTMAQIQHALDSLNDLELPVFGFERKLDSLLNLQDSALGLLDKELSEIKEKFTAKLEQLDIPPELKEYAKELKSSIKDLDVHLPDTGIALVGLDLSKHLNFKFGLTNPFANYLKDLPTLPGMESWKGVVSLTKGVGQISSELTSVAKGDLSGVSSRIEGKVSDLAGLDSFQDQMNIPDLPDFSNQEAVQKALSTELQKQAINHFAGKDVALKEAMEKISGYKQKYSSLPSLEDVPKRIPNAMKGKPFIERVVPGIYFQLQTKSDWLFDFNPYVGFKISGRILAGAGWNHRIAYDFKSNQSNEYEIIYGPRGFVDVGLGKGFIAHVEGEVMNAYVPALSTIDDGTRQWVWGIMTGLKKEYRIYKNLRGTILIQYNWLDIRNTSPYVDRLNMRLGFEQWIKKKTKEKKEE